MTSLRRWGLSVVDLLFPRVCTVCHTTLVEGEDIMCIKCMLGLPRVSFTDYHENELTQRLASLRAPIQRATSYYYHIPDTDYVSLIHDTKYNRRPIVGRRLAQAHARELMATNFFEGIDLILPIPLHFTKEWQRGYNQSYEIASGLSDITGIPVGDNLIATRPHSTQTRKRATERRINLSGTFRVIHPEELSGLHVVVVDDVITTGSTILSGLETIHTASPDTRLSAYSLALAKLR